MGKQRATHGARVPPASPSDRPHSAIVTGASAASWCAWHWTQPENTARSTASRRSGECRAITSRRPADGILTSAGQHRCRAVAKVPAGHRETPYDSGPARTRVMHAMNYLPASAIAHHPRGLTAAMCSPQRGSPVLVTTAVFPVAMPHRSPEANLPQAVSPAGSTADVL